MKKLLQILCLTFFAGMLAACGGDGPEKTAKTFFEELFNGDAGKAMDLVYIPPEAAAKGKSKEVVKGKLTMLTARQKEKMKKEGGSITGIDIGEVHYTNADKTTAKVEIIVKTKIGSETSEKKNKVPLIKTDKGWRIKM